jgi:hypothetical protein
MITICMRSFRTGLSSCFDRATVVYIPCGLSLQISRFSFHPSTYGTSIWIPPLFSPGWLPAFGGSDSVAHACRWQKAKTVPDSNTSMFNKMSIRVTITDDHIYRGWGVYECTSSDGRLNHISPFTIPWRWDFKCPNCPGWRNCLFIVTSNSLATSLHRELIKRFKLSHVPKQRTEAATELWTEPKYLTVQYDISNIEVRQAWSFTSTSQFVSHNQIYSF